MPIIRELATASLEGASSDDTGYHSYSTGSPNSKASSFNLLDAIRRSSSRLQREIRKRIPKEPSEHGAGAHTRRTHLTFSTVTESQSASSEEATDQHNKALSHFKVSSLSRGGQSQFEEREDEYLEYEVDDEEERDGYDDSRAPLGSYGQSVYGQSSAYGEVGAYNMDYSSSAFDGGQPSTYSWAAVAPHAIGYEFAPPPPPPPLSSIPVFPIQQDHHQQQFMAYDATSEELGQLFSPAVRTNKLLHSLATNESETEAARSRSASPLQSFESESVTTDEDSWEDGTTPRERSLLDGIESRGTDFTMATEDLDEEEEDDASDIMQEVGELFQNVFRVRQGTMKRLADKVASCDFSNLRFDLAADENDDIVTVRSNQRRRSNERRGRSRSPRTPPHYLHASDDDDDYDDQSGDVIQEVETPRLHRRQDGMLRLMFGGCS